MSGAFTNGRLPARYASPEALAQASGLSVSILYSADAEKAVLASMMSRPEEVIDIVLEKLQMEDFFVDADQKLFGVVSSMHEAGEPIDITTLHQRAVDLKLAEGVGSPSY